VMGTGWTAPGMGRIVWNSINENASTKRAPASFRVTNRIVRKFAPRIRRSLMIWLPVNAATLSATRRVNRRSPRAEDPYVQQRTWFAHGL